MATIEATSTNWTAAPSAYARRPKPRSRLRATTWRRNSCLARFFWHVWPYHPNILHPALMLLSVCTRLVCLRARPFILSILSILPASDRNTPKTQWQQSPVPATRVVGRVIPRSNSSPDATPTASSRSRPFGSGASNGGGGATTAATAVAAASLDAPPVTAPSETENPPTLASGHPAAAESPLPRGWRGGDGDSGGGGGGGGVGGNLDASADDFARNTVSAPLLGSFPFALWNMGTRTAAAEPEAARPERDSGGGSGGSSRSSGGSSLRVEGGRGG